MMNHRTFAFATSTPVLVACCLALVNLSAWSADSHSVTINTKISSRVISLNQPLRLGFITLPRQIDNVDIAVSVANAISLSTTSSWRMLGKPSVIEHDKTKTIEVSVLMLPRNPGKIMLPQIPLTWLSGDQIADFGEVTVEPKILIGGDQDDIPKEASGVAGFAWGTKLASIKTTRIADNLIEEKADRTIAHVQSGLDLVFRSGDLAEAVVSAPNLSLEQARDSFVSRWGLPQLEDMSATNLPTITWLIGWTRISATPNSKDETGVRLTLVREDIEQRLAQSRVKGAVFDVLEGTGIKQPVESPEQVQERLKHEAEDFLKSQAQNSTGNHESPPSLPKPGDSKATDPKAHVKTAQTPNDN